MRSKANFFLKIWFAIFLVGLFLFCSMDSGNAAIDPDDREWLAVSLFALLADSPSVQPALFYTWRHQFDAGIIIRNEREKRVSLDFGVTDEVFSLGVSRQISDSRFYISGGVASQQDRWSTTPYLALTWRYSRW